MNIFLREMRAGRKSWLVWTVSLSLLTLLEMWVYPTIAESGQALIQMVESLPRQLTAAFGFDRIQFTDPVGFFGTELYSFIMLFGGIYAVLLGATMLAKEESERTAEFLLAKPVSRASIVSQKGATVFAYITLFDVAVTLVSLLAFGLFVKGTYDVGTIVQLMLGAFLCTLSFGGVGFLVSATLRGVRSAYPLAVGGVLIMYFLSLFSGLTNKLEWAKYLTPFKYVDAADIIVNGLQPVSIAVLLGVTATCVALTYAVYERKDIHV